MPVWSVGTFLTIMNTTMFNVSLPTILADLHITPEMGSLIVSGYSVVYAVSTVIASRLSDILPIRWLITAALALLGTASVLGFAAHSFALLLTARVLQAPGAGAVAALGVMIASRYIPYERRGRALSLISAAVALGFGLGPILGGVLTGWVRWNALFLVVCLVLPLMPLLWRVLPEEPMRPAPFDGIGAALLGAAATSLLLAVTLRTVWLVTVTAVCGVACAWHLRRSHHPFIDPALFTNPAYRRLLPLPLCAFMINMSLLFLIPLILARGFGMPASRIGLVLFPGSLLSAVLTRWIGRWIDEHGNVPFLVIGHALVMAAIAAMALLVQLSPWILVATYLVFSPALSMLTASISNELSRVLVTSHLGAGMGLAQLSQFFGGAIAVAGCGLVLAVTPKWPVFTTFRLLFGGLTAVMVCSLALLLWHLRQSRRAMKQMAPAAGTGANG